MPDPIPATKTPHKPKGSASQPPRQQYHAARKSPAIRRLTKAYRSFVGGRRLVPEERSMLAFFTMGYEVGERPD